MCAFTVQVLLRESQIISESKDKQIAELKKMSEHSADSLRNEWEKKVRTKNEGLGLAVTQAKLGGKCQMTVYRQNLLSCTADPTFPPKPANSAGVCLNSSGVCLFLDMLRIEDQNPHSGSKVRTFLLVLTG